MLTVTPATAMIGVTPYTGVTYDGSPHKATGTATGVTNVNLSGDLNLTGTTHSNAGTYPDTWTFHDPSGNYADASGPVSDSIAKASSTIVITISGGPFTYDAMAQTPARSRPPEPAA